MITLQHLIALSTRDGTIIFIFDLFNVWLLKLIVDLLISISRTFGLFATMGNADFFIGATIVVIRDLLLFITCHGSSGPWLEVSNY